MNPSTKSQNEFNNKIEKKQVKLSELTKISEKLNQKYKMILSNLLRNLQPLF